MCNDLSASPVMLHLAAIGAGPSAAQGFKPAQPIEFVVHTGPGGGNDVLARAIVTIVGKGKAAAGALQVVNKPGGGG